MKVKAESLCPICSKRTKLIEYFIKAGDFPILKFRCPSCKITFTTKCTTYKIDQGEISFSKSGGVIEIFWKEDENFNPTER